MNTAHRVLKAPEEPPVILGSKRPYQSDNTHESGRRPRKRARIPKLKTPRNLKDTISLYPRYQDDVVAFPPFLLDNPRRNSAIPPAIPLRDLPKIDLLKIKLNSRKSSLGLRYIKVNQDPPKQDFVKQANELCIGYVVPFLITFPKKTAPPLPFDFSDKIPRISLTAAMKALAHIQPQKSVIFKPGLEHCNKKFRCYRKKSR